MNDIIIKEATLDNEPWNKMRNESAKAYAAFLSYKNLPARDRSLRKACIEHYGSATSSKIRQFQHWSARNMWVDRAVAWDQYVAQEADEKELEAIKRMREQHLTVAQGLMAKAVERLKNLDPLELNTSDVLRYLSEAIRIQRVTHGEPDSIQETQGETSEITFAEMDDQQLIAKIVQLRINRQGQKK